MKIFVDSDVLLDVGLEREPFCHASGQLLDYLESHSQQGFIAWHSVANIFYLFSKAATREEAKSFILELCQFLQVVPTSTNDVLIAANLPFKDFEDAMQCAAAMAGEATESGIDSAPGNGINSGLQRQLNHYSLFIMLNSLTIKNFTVFSEAKLEFSPGLNVVIGENATGKSHLLKLVYAITSIWHEAADEHEDLPGKITSGGSKNWWQRRLAEKLVSVFKPDRLGHLSRRDTGRQPTEINATLFTNCNCDETLKFVFTAQSKKEVEILQIPHQGLPTSPIFLPAKDVLELYPGLIKLYEDRELTMDETYPDLCKSLSRVLLKKPPAQTFVIVLEALEKILGGKVHLEKGRFYFKPLHQKVMEVSLMADGLRKIATLAHLIANASLQPQSLLLWDEIETHLNAKLLTPLSRLLMELVEKHQMQVILTTHNFFLMKELSLLVELSKNQIPARFFSLRMDEAGVAVEQGDLLEDLQTIVVLDEWLQLDDREQALFLQG